MLLRRCEEQRRWPLSCYQLIFQAVLLLWHSFTLLLQCLGASVRPGVKFLMGFLASSQFKGTLRQSPTDACSKRSLRRRFECSSSQEGFLQEVYHTP